ncbi:MAG: patatin-like phospholipase family protein [Deltaproteobacteria bacterium]
MNLRADAVFEGGGVKGIGLVGAVAELEKAGYEFVNLAGTSAGAIVASLLAVGYKAEEIKSELERLDYNSFKDKGLLDKLGIIGKGLGIGFEYGIYEGKHFEEWLEDLLTRRNRTTFGEIITDEYKKGEEDEKYKYRLQVIAADITDRRLLVLPGDLKALGYDPDQFRISRAVRMSMSIPFFFEPVKIQDTDGRVHYIVDGGVLSNYPIWLLDDNKRNPPWPTFGFKLMEPDKRILKPADHNPINNPVSFLKSLMGTMMDAHDNYHVSISKGDYDRTIGIPTVVSVKGVQREIKTVDFDITQDESRALYENGGKAGAAFLKKWDFAEWKKKYRQVRVGSGHILS